MRRSLLYLILYIGVLFTTTSCERRDLTYVYHPYCDVTLNVNWTVFGQVPTGMTAIFYNQNGSEPVVHTTNEVHTTKISLREGKYNIILFNQSPGEFGSLSFRGLENYQSAEVFLQEVSSKWYTKDENEKIAAEPEPFAAVKYENFEVTEEMVEASMALLQKSNKTKGSKSPLTKATITLTPRSIVSNTNIIIKAHGIHNVRSVRATIHGMAESHFPAFSKNGSQTVTHLLEAWSTTRNANDYTKGELTTSFTTLGLPNSDIYSNDIDPLLNNLKLKLSVLLVDNKTIKTFEFTVGNNIRIERDTNTGTLIITIIIGEPAEGDPDGSTDPSDNPIELPDVEPEGGSSSGFDATVDDWGDEENIEIEL